MLPSFTSHESPQKSPAFRAAIETCENDSAWGEYYVHIDVLRDFPHPQPNEAAPAVRVAPSPEVASTAINQAARYAAYEESAETRRLIEIRRQVNEQARSAQERIHEADA